MSNIKVVCFYWQGDRWQENEPDTTKVEDQSYKNHLARSSELDREMVHRYVNNLYEGVKKWASKDFDFICFTNEDLKVNPEIELRPFTMVSSLGVLPRMYMFSEEAGLFGNQVISLDLDVVITGSLDRVMSYDRLFAVRKRWMPGQYHLPDGDIMSFQAGQETQSLFWAPLVRDTGRVEKVTKGRERFWIAEVVEQQQKKFGVNMWDDWDDFILGQVVSYKWHVKPNGLGDARIVSCHGHPRPHEIDEQWRQENWK